MQQTLCVNGLARSQNIIYTERPSSTEKITHQGTITTVQESTFSFHFTTTYLPRNDGLQQPVIVAVNVSSPSGAYLREVHDKYAEVRGTENEEYLLYTVIGPSKFPLNLDINVAEAGFGITNPWMTARPFSDINNCPILLLQDSEDDSNNVGRGNPITLKVFTTTHNVTQTPITTIVTIPTYSKERLRLFCNSLHSTLVNPLNMNSTVDWADLDNSHPWVEASRIDNKFYASVPSTHSDDYSEAIFNSGTNMSASSEEATFPEYNIDLDGAPCMCTLTTRGKNGSSTVTLTMNPCDPMQHALDKYSVATILWHTPKQGIVPMIDSGT